jgi:hypothetical protein
MTDNTNTIIYKIQHKENKELIYIGYTTNFKKRQQEHKLKCKDQINFKRPSHLYKIINSNGGWDAFDMTIVESFFCNNGKKEILQKELYYIVKYNCIMNKNKPIHFINIK